MDWALGNNEWLQEHGNVKADYLTPCVSNHSPVLIHCTPAVLTRPKPFNLFKTMLEHPQFGETVTNTWAQSYNVTRMYQLNLKLRTLKTNLKDLKNTTYKIITKVLTNRMKEVINTIISPSQLAFVEGRSIIDNISFMNY